MNWGIELLRFTMKTLFISKKNVSLNYLEYDINLVLYSSDRKKLTNVIIWEMHGFPHKFSTVQEMQQNPWCGESLQNWCSYFFPKYGCVFSIRFPSYGILHQMRNAWVSPSIFHSAGKCNETYHMGRTWETSAHTFPIAWALFFH